MPSRTSDTTPRESAGPTTEPGAGGQVRRDGPGQGSGAAPRGYAKGRAKRDEIVEASERFVRIARDHGLSDTEIRDLVAAGLLGGQDPRA